MSASVQPSSGLPAWRVAIIAIVGLLSVGIGVAAGSFLLTARSTGLGSAAGYVPADAVFYVELRIEPSAGQDAALREALGRFPPIEGIDLGLPLYGQLTERLDEVLAEAGPEVSWADDVAPWFDGHVAIAVTDLPLEMEPVMGGMGPMPSAVVLVGVRDRAAAQASIDSLLAEAGAPDFTERDHAGVAVHVPETAEPGSGAWALTEDQLIIGSDVETVTAALDTHAAGTETVAGAAGSDGLLAPLPADWLAFMTFDMTELMAQSLTMAEAQDPALAEAFSSLLEHQPMRGAMAVSATGDRLLIDATTGAPTGPFAVENAELGLADEVPADALYYSDASNLGAALTGMVAPLRQAIVSMPGGEEQLRTAESALGADLEELVSWIDDGAIAVGYDGASPWGGLVIVPNDVDAARRRLGQLATFASLAATDPASGIFVEESELAGTTVTTIRWESPEPGSDFVPMPTGFLVEYAVTDDRALIGLGDGFLARALELDAADSLAAQPRFADAIDEVGGVPNAGMAWIDLAGSREAIEGAMAPLLGAFDGMAVYRSEVQPWLLPLDRFVSVSRLDGEMVIQRAALLFE